MWEPQRLTALRASTACYSDSYTYTNNLPIFSVFVRTCYLKKKILWEVTTVNMVEIHRRFGGTCCLIFRVRSFYFDPIYLQTVHVHLANSVMLQRHVEECSVALLCIQQVQGLVCLLETRLRKLKGATKSSCFLMLLCLVLRLCRWTSLTPPKRL
jgi:hypothetical protein